MARPVEPSSSSSPSSKKTRAASAAPKSKAKESFELIKPPGKKEMTQLQSYFALSKSKKEVLINQLELRGFDNTKDWPKIKKMKKPQILEIIKKLIDEEKWV